MKRLCLLAVLLAVRGLGQPTLPNAVPMPTPEIQYLNADGTPMVGGKLCTYAAGTSTPLATYTSSTAGASNTNPIILDPAGRASVWVGPRLYKFVLRTGGTANSCNDGAIIWSQDNVADTTLYFANYVKTVGTSSLITYICAQAGCTIRTTESKDRDTYSTYDFGAVCDGSTDDSAVIQTGITTMIALGSGDQAGGELVFPPGKTCSVGTAGLTIPNTATGITLSSPVMQGATLTYSGTVAALTIGAVGDTVYNYRTTIKGLRFDITGAGANAAGVLMYSSLYWRLQQIRVKSDNAFSASANHQVGIKFSGGESATFQFGAHGVWDQVQVQGKFRFGVYLTAVEVGWGFNANLFSGGTVNYEGTAPAGETPPYTGFYMEQGNQNLTQMIDAENWDVAFQCDAYENTWVAIREESASAKGFIFGPASGTVSGGVFNKLYSSTMGDGVTNPSLSNQLWGTTTDLGIENHITSVADLDTTMHVTGNSSIIWDVEGGSAGLYWHDTATHTHVGGALYNSGGGPVLQCGDGSVSRSCTIQSNGGSIVMQIDGVTLATVNSNGILTPAGINVTGNHGISFNQAGGGGSTGVYWNTGPGAIFNGNMIDNGSQLIVTTGTSGSSRDYVVNVVNTTSQHKFQINGSDILELNSFSGVVALKPIFMAPVLFAGLGTPSVGAMVFCTDCHVTTPCTSGGNGAWAFRVNGPAWNCPF